METVTVKGKVYQIGEPYNVGGGIEYLIGKDGHCLLFSNDADLTTLTTSSPSELVSAMASIGTITNAPIELENYDVCEFEVNGFRSAGIYNQERNCFMSAGNKVCGFGEATMIIPLRERT